MAVASVRYNGTIHDGGLLNALLGVPATERPCGLGGLDALGDEENLAFLKQALGADH